MPEIPGKISPREIRRDFVNDYGALLTGNGFVKRGNTYYRIHGSDVLLYVRAAIFPSEWTISFCAYAFSAGYTDMNGYDGVRMSSIIRQAFRKLGTACPIDFGDRENANYQRVRDAYHTEFIDKVFPVFNSISSVYSYNEFRKWHAELEGLTPDYEHMALACFQVHDYAQGAAYLEQYLEDCSKAYRKKLAQGADNFTRIYEMYTGFIDQLKTGNPSRVDAYISEKTAITAETCMKLKLLSQQGG